MHGGGISPSTFQKGGQRCLFIKGVEAGTFWGCDFCPKDFCPHIPKLARKVICAILPAIFLPQRSSRPFFGVTSKKGLHVFFCKPRAPFFEVKQRLVPFLPGFSGILPRFSANQNFWGCACTPTSNTTAFHYNIIGNFVVYQNRLAGP